MKEDKNIVNTAISTLQPLGIVIPFVTPFLLISKVISNAKKWIFKTSINLQ